MSLVLRKYGFMVFLPCFLPLFYQGFMMRRQHTLMAKIKSGGQDAELQLDFTSERSQSFHPFGHQFLCGGFKSSWTPPMPCSVIQPAVLSSTDESEMSACSLWIQNRVWKIHALKCCCFTNKQFLTQINVLLFLNTVLTIRDVSFSGL